MAEPKKIEYRVKAVERYIITRYLEDTEGNVSVVERGTFSSPYIALEVAHALGKTDQSAAAPHTSVQYPNLLDPNVPQDGQLQEMIENKANYLAGMTEQHWRAPMTAPKADAA